MMRWSCEGKKKYLYLCVYLWDIIKEFGKSAHTDTVPSKLAALSMLMPLAYNWRYGERT